MHVFHPTIVDVLDLEEENDSSNDEERYHDDIVEG